MLTPQDVRVKVFSKASNQEGTVPVSQFDPKVYNLLEDPTRYPELSKKIDDYKRKLTTSGMPSQSDLHINPEDAIVAGGTALGGAVGGVPGAAAGGVLAKGAVEAYKNIKDGTEVPDFVSRLKMLAGQAAESGAAEIGGQLLTKGIGLGAHLTAKGVSRSLDFIEGLPNKTLEKIFANPGKTYNMTVGNTTLDDIVQTAKGAILKYGENIGRVYNKGLNEIKQLYPNFTLDSVPIKQQVDDFLRSKQLLTEEGNTIRPDFSLTGLDEAGQKSLQKAYEVIQKADQKMSFEELRALKQRLNNFYRDGEENDKYNFFLQGMKNAIDNAKDFPDELKTLNQFYTKKMDTFNKLIYKFDPKNKSFVVDKAETALKQAGKPDEKFATKKLLDELKAKTGVDILHELDLYDIGRIMGKRPPAAISSPFNFVGDVSQKVAGGVSAMAGGLNKLIPSPVKSVLRIAFKGLSTAEIQQLLDEVLKPESK